MGIDVQSSTMDDDDIQSSILYSFLKITTTESVESLKQFLDATTWKLNDAVNLFFYKKALVEGPCSWSSSSSSYSPRSPPLMRNPNRYHHQTGFGKFWKDEGSSRFSKDEDQVVSATLPVRTEGDEMKVKTSESNQIWEESDSLSSMYQPPLDLMYKGSFEDAKQEASKVGKWVLLNLQSRKEFNSHKLNRDTWSNEGVAQIIKTNFIFLQVYDDKIEGLKISSLYDLVGLIPPVVLLVDPITGNKMCSWNGMIEGERLMEVLFPYLEETGVKGIINPTISIEQTIESTDQKSNVNEEEKLDEEMVLALESTDQKSNVNEEEKLDEEMVLALAAPTSMEGLMNDDDAASTSTSADMNEEPPMMYEESSSSSSSSDEEEDNCLMEEKKRITYIAFPEEPQTAERNLVCRFGFRRHQDGRRVQRSFMDQLLWYSCFGLALALSLMK